MARVDWRPLMGHLADNRQCNPEREQRIASAEADVIAAARLWRSITIPYLKDQALKELEAKVDALEALRKGA